MISVGRLIRGVLVRPCDTPVGNTGPADWGRDPDGEAADKLLIELTATVCGACIWPDPGMACPVTFKVVV